MIHLIDNYYLDADEKQFILAKEIGKRVDRRTGKERTAYDFLYYSDLGNALAGLCVRQTRLAVAESNSLEELMAKQDEIKKLIAELDKKYSSLTYKEV